MNQKLPLSTTLLLLLISMSNSSIACSQTDLKDDTHQQILSTIQKGELEEASSQIDAHLKEHPHAHKIHRLRSLLSNAYFRSKNRKEGERQIELMLQYQFGDPVNSRPLLKYLPQLLINLSYVQQNIEPKASAVLDQSIKLLSVATKEDYNNFAYSNGLTSAIGLKARLLARHTKADQALSMYQQELDRLRGRWLKSQENPDAWIRLVYFLRAAEEALGFEQFEIVEAWDLERRNLIAAAIEEFPQATRIVKEYFAVQLKTIQEYEETCPRQAVKMYSSATKEIRAVIEKQLVKKGLFTLRIEIEKRAIDLNRKLRRVDIVGETVPKLEQIDWLSDSTDAGVTETPDLSSGKVVLLFVSRNSKGTFNELGQLNDLLKNRFPDTKLVAVIHDVGKPFSMLPFVTYKSKISDDQRQQFRNQLIDKVIKKNKFEFSFGVGLNNIELARQFGISKAPHALRLNDGKCTGCYSFDELISSFENQSTVEMNKESK